MAIQYDEGMNQDRRMEQWPHVPLRHATQRPGLVPTIRGKDLNTVDGNELVSTERGCSVAGIVSVYLNVGE